MAPEMNPQMMGAPETRQARHLGQRPAPLHQQALRHFGPSPVHRLTFAPVRALVEGHGAMAEGEPE